MISEALFKISNELPRAVEQPFKDNYLANYIRGDATNIIKNNSPKKYEDFIFKGSAGQGQWVSNKNCWIGIFNPEICHGAQSGYYVVYGIPINSRYITFGIGQAYEEAQEKYGKNWEEAINQHASLMRLKIPSYSKYFSSDKHQYIDSDKAIYYGKGFVYHKIYDALNLPDEENLKDDLRLMLNAYNELFLLGGRDLDISNANQSSVRRQDKIEDKKLVFKAYQSPESLDENSSDILIESGAKKRKKAHNSHNKMETEIATFLSESGFKIEKLSSGPAVDLCWKTANGISILEVKSINKNNEHHQLRMAIGQLTEYKYRFQKMGEKIDKCYIAITQKTKKDNWNSILESVGIELIDKENISKILIK